MKRRFRLRQSNDIQRVRRQGKSYAHPLLILVVLPAIEMQVRVGVIAGHKVGNAVHRNRARRRIRACIDQLLPEIKIGWDLLIFARQPISSVESSEISHALADLLHRAKILEKLHGT